MKAKVGGVTLECVQGNIAQQEEFDGVVNAANAQLKPGGGVAGVLHRGAGPGLEEEGRKFAPIRPGEAVLTGGHGLPNRYVIHCLGPVYGVDEPAAELLARCYRNALDIAEANGIETVAFPAISTGAFGYPMREAAEVAFRTILADARNLRRVKRIRFVLYDRRSREVHDDVLSTLLNGRTVEE